jgi:hypothetical protein
MRTLVSAMIVLATLATSGCGSTGGGGGGGADGPATAKNAQPAAPTPMEWGIPPAPQRRSSPATARTNAHSDTARSDNGRAYTGRSNNNGRSNGTKPNAANAKPLPKDPNVSILKIDDSEVPAAVKAIEKLVDKRSALLADTVRIEVSKNYEWDVSLSGDAVSPHRPDRGGTISEATGNPRAYFRNLDIRARDKIVIWRSGLGVTPFIRVWAKGAVSYIDTDDATGKPRVKRAGNCKISNASIAFDQEILGVPGMEAAPAQPTALREKTK